MSFVADNEDEDKKPQVSPEEQGASQTDISLGGGGSGVETPGGGGNVGGARANAQPQVSNKPSSSGQWTNLQDYLTANKEQSGQLGSDVGGAVTGQAEKAKSQIQNVSQDFNNQVNSQLVQSNPDEVNQAIEHAKSLKAGETYGQSDLDNFQKQANASYNGPTDFTRAPGYGQAQDYLGKAQSSIKALGSESGRDVLLKNQYANASENGYNQGETNLDQLLLANNPQNQESFKGIQSKYAGIDKALLNEATKGNQAASDVIANNQATSEAARAAAAKAESEWESGVNSQFETNKTTQAQQLNDIVNAIKTEHLDQNQLKAIGLDPGTHTYGLSGNQLADYITPGLAPTLYNTASADQYAQASALASLIGQPSYLPSEYSAQAGTATTPFNFNKARFQSDSESAKQNLQSEVNQALNKIRSEIYLGGHNTPGDVMGQQEENNGYPVNGSQQDQLQWAISNILNPGGSMSNIVRNPYMDNYKYYSDIVNQASPWQGILDQLNHTIGTPNGINAVPK